MQTLQNHNSNGKLAYDGVHQAIDTFNTDGGLVIATQATCHMLHASSLHAQIHRLCVGLHIPATPKYDPTQGHATLAYIVIP